MIFDLFKMVKHAEMDGQHRFFYCEQWDLEKRAVMYLISHPKAMHPDNDLTISRIRNIAKKDKTIGSIIICSLFSRVMISSKFIGKFENTIHPQNDEWVVLCSEIANETILCYGNVGKIRPGLDDLIGRLKNKRYSKNTNIGFPSHPLNRYPHGKGIKKNYLG